MRSPRLAVAIESSGAPGSAAARFGGAIEERELAAAAAHGRALLPTLGECLERLGARAGEIDLVVVGTGPGSYTGLRVGIATAKGIALARRCALLGVPSAEALAEAFPPEEARVAVAIDARRGEVFGSVYERVEGRLECRAEPALLRPQALAALAGPGTPALGDGALLHAEVLRRAGLRVDPSFPARPRAGTLLRIGVRRYLEQGAGPLPEARPLYLRPSAAEEKRASTPPPTA